MKSSLFGFAVVLFFFGLLAPGSLKAAPQEKEWTFLVFLNGHNNLDSFGAININQMETVGSTNDLNLVVQWASMGFGDKTKRLLVTKDTDESKVTSPIVQEIPRADMGDYHAMVEFVKWAHENYPAKHYFLDIWNHGGGWHRSNTFRDISTDDYTGNIITTPQMGTAAEEIAKIIGHKLDIMGTDACLMAMAEVGFEVADNVSYLVASEEVIPGMGWPYHKFVPRWAASPKATAAEVGKMVDEEYAKFYSSGSDAADGTLSTMDLSKFAALNSALYELAQAGQKLSSSDVTKLLSVVSSTQGFYFSDYKDLGDLVANLKKAGISAFSPAIFTHVETAMKSFMVDSQVTPSFKKATGVSIWMPSSKSTYSAYSNRYKLLKFPGATGWQSMLEWIFK